MVVPTALGAGLIRLGNFTNSEIVGKICDPDLPWGVIFENRTDLENYLAPRHPVQLYEGIAYFLIFGFLMFLYWRTQAKDRRGELVGWFMTLVFSARFFLEDFFLEENQLLNDAAVIADIPGSIVQGRHDICTPPGAAWALKKAWPKGDLWIVDDAGHSASEPGIVDGLVRATDHFAPDVSGGDE